MISKYLMINTKHNNHAKHEMLGIIFENLHLPDNHLRQNIAKGTVDLWVSSFAKIIA